MNKKSYRIMTQEEKVKAYDEAVERARKYMAKGYDVLMPEIFPELAESEDERIRKEMLNVFKQLDEGTTICGRNYDYAKWIAWLEKQGEKKPIIKMKSPEESLGISSKEYNDIVNDCLYGKSKSAEWSEEDDYNLQCIIAKVDSDIQKGNVGRNQELIDWLKALKERYLPQPKQEWSEEDENRINRLIAYFEDKESFTAEDDIVYANWLKSLKLQRQWKPSEGQLECLGYAIEKAEKDWSPLANNRIYLTLKALKEQLEKLKIKKI
jgi:hypothetical protein